jgi:hypothetical protein
VCATTFPAAVSDAALPSHRYCCYHPVLDAADLATSGAKEFS